MDPDPDQVFKEPEVISNGSMAFDNTKVYDHISIFNGLVYETTGKKKIQDGWVRSEKDKILPIVFLQNFPSRLFFEHYIEYQVTNLGNYCTKEEYVWKKIQVTRKGTRRVGSIRQ